MANLVSIKVEDGGDGSTFFTVTFDDGTEVRANPDVPYDGYIVLHYEDGRFREETVESDTLGL